MPIARADRRIATTLRELIALLVAGDDLTVARKTAGSRVPVHLMRHAITEYGHRLANPPIGAFDEIDAIEVIGSSPSRWSVCFNFWTVDGGRSDLTLEATLIETNDEQLIVQIDNVHVL